VNVLHVDVAHWVEGGVEQTFGVPMQLPRPSQRSSVVHSERVEQLALAGRKVVTQDPAAAVGVQAYLSATAPPQGSAWTWVQPFRRHADERGAPC
jgi:hypothetical protein